MKTLIASLAASASLTLSAISAAPPEQGFIAHEWGTFTSLQPADGVQMHWSPRISSDLPGFVYEINRVRDAKNISRLKEGTYSRQRMETPVVYFYSDTPRTVDVSIRFPQGQITEWYPLREAADLSYRQYNFSERNRFYPLSPVRPLSPLNFEEINETREALKEHLRPALFWKGLEIHPQGATLKDIPADKTGSHYYAARGTDAALVRVTTEDKKTETEKFLFYRGTGSFEAPLNVKVGPLGEKQIILTNQGDEPLRHLFVYQLGRDGTTWLSMDELKPGETRTVALDDREHPLPPMLDALRAGLVREGLYEKEAAAMVKTWQSSWFEEPGLRVLYTLPRIWTDRTLPLTITPAPEKVQRVMIGRAEILTPAMELAVTAQLEKYLAAELADRGAIVAEVRSLGLGRFTASALQRAMEKIRKPSLTEKESLQFYTNSWQLIQAATAPEKPKTAAR